MKLKDLAGEHLGQTVTITTPDASVTGVLAGVEHHCDLIDVSTITDAIANESRYAPGRSYVAVTIAGWGSRDFSPNAECEFPLHLSKS